MGDGPLAMLYFVCEIFATSPFLRLKVIRHILWYNPADSQFDHPTTKHIKAANSDLLNPEIGIPIATMRWFSHAQALAAAVLYKVFVGPGGSGDWGDRSAQIVVVRLPSRGILAHLVMFVQKVGIPKTNYSHPTFRFLVNDQWRGNYTIEGQDVTGPFHPWSRHLGHLQMQIPSAAKQIGPVWRMWSADCRKELLRLQWCEHGQFQPGKWM